MTLFRPFESNSVKLRLISTDPKYVKPLKVPLNCGGSVILCSHLFFMPDFSFDRFSCIVTLHSVLTVSNTLILYGGRERTEKRSSGRLGSYLIKLIKKMNILITFSLSSGPRPFSYALRPLSAGFHQHGRLLRLPDAGDMFDEVLQHEYEMFYTLRDLRVRVEPFHKVHLSRLFYLLIRLMMGCVWMPP